MKQLLKDESAGTQPRESEREADVSFLESPDFERGNEILVVLNEVFDSLECESETTENTLVVNV